MQLLVVLLNQNNQNLRVLQIATAVLLEVLRKTGSGSLTMTINNGKDGEMLWRFFKTMNDNISL
jgi:hypothetical protein